MGLQERFAFRVLATNKLGISGACSNVTFCKTPTDLLRYHSRLGHYAHARKSGYNQTQSRLKQLRRQTREQEHIEKKQRHLSATLGVPRSLVELGVGAGLCRNKAHQEGKRTPSPDQQRRTQQFDQHQEVSVQIEEMRNLMSASFPQRSKGKTGKQKLRSNTNMALISSHYLNTHDPRMFAPPNKYISGKVSPYGHSNTAWSSTDKKRIPNTAKSSPGGSMPLARNSRIAKSDRNRVGVRARGRGGKSRCSEKPLRNSTSLPAGKIRPSTAGSIVKSRLGEEVGGMVPGRLSPHLLSTVSGSKSHQDDRGRDIRMWASAMQNAGMG